MMKYWNGYQWCRIDSDQEVNARRARGDRVREWPDAVVAPVEPVEDDAPVIVVETPDPEAIAGDAGASRARRCSNCSEPGHTKAKCPLLVEISDEDLERLTAPDGGEG